MKIGGAPPQMFPGPGQDRSTSAPDQDAAIGFNELGVFGLKRPADGSTADRAPTPPFVDPLRAPDPDQPRPTQILSPDPEPPSAPSLPVAQLLAGLDETVAIPGDTPPAPASRPTGAGQNFEMPGPIVDGDGGAPPAEEVPPPSAAAARKADASYGLSVVTKGETVSVAATAPPLDANGRALLRKLLRQLLSERRLSLTDFHLNGVPLGADFLSMTGGSHGPGAR